MVISQAPDLNASPAEGIRRYLSKTLGVNASYMEDTRSVISQAPDVIAFPVEGIRRNLLKTPSVMTSSTAGTGAYPVRSAACLLLGQYNNGKGAMQSTSRRDMSNINSTSVDGAIAKSAVSWSGAYYLVPLRKTLCRQPPLLSARTVRAGALSPNRSSDACQGLLWEVSAPCPQP